MKDRGKSVEVFAGNFSDFNFSAASEIPCKKHPNSPSVGICPHCLKDRLIRLVCSECGEQRLSSCSCSDVSSSSYRNSCSTMEVGSVGRVSFLIENDKIDPNPNPRPKIGDNNNSRSDQVIFLRRSTSSCVEVKKSNGFWKIKRLFKKKKLQRGFDRNGESCDDKSEVWVSDVMGVSRSRSLCSFRGFDDDRSALSSAKISDVTSGVFVDADRQFGGLGEFEHRRSDFRGIGNNHNRRQQNLVEVFGRGAFPAKESDFSDDSAFIDLKVEEFSGGRMSCSSDHGGGGGSRHESSLNSGVSFANMKSSGVMVNERRKGHRVWKWIFKYHPANKKGDK